MGDDDDVGGVDDDDVGGVDVNVDIICIYIYTVSIVLLLNE